MSRWPCGVLTEDRAGATAGATHAVADGQGWGSADHGHSRVYSGRGIFLLVAAYL